MLCPGCEFDNPEGMNFCGKCGTNLSPRCAQCDFENPPGFQFCGKCGASLNPQPVPTSAQIEPKDEQPVPVETPSREVPSSEAERRQLTVMFCDLVGSTSLSGELDPEDLRDIVREYQRTCTDVIQRYDGYVAQLLGDGLLVYFGFPQAHEDDAQRAIHTGLGIVKAIGDLNTRLEQTQGVKLAVRLGIHTGLVVIGEMGGEGRQEQLALGETPNVAARIQGIAAPNVVVISDATYRLAQVFFDAEPLGEHELRGIAQPIAVYRVKGDSGMQSRLDVASTRGLTPLVGRESESTLLFERWEQAKSGQGQVVLLSGEAGIGKSRLVEVIKDHVSEDNHARLECRSSPYFANSALYPIIDMLQRVLRWQQDEMPEQRLEKLEQNLSQYRLPLEETVPLFASLLSLPIPEDRYPSLNLSPQRQRQKTLEAILAIMLELAEREPVLFILEDLHWTDPTTLEFFDLLLDQIPTVSLCVLSTCRPDFQPPWQHRSYLTEVTVNRLSRNQIERLAEQVSGGKSLPTDVLQQLVEKTDGVPLYVEEMTKSVLESGVLKEVDDEYELSGSISTLSIPATLQDSLMARLDRLVTAKAVAQYASVIGRQFSYELLRGVSELDDATLQRELARLVEAELVYQRGLPPQSTYVFKHALVQDIASASLLHSTRQGYHRRIAEVLTGQVSETAEIQPELLAYHYTEAGLNEQAVEYWQQAGQRARERSAHAETIGHLTKCIALLVTLPETAERHRRELTMQTTLGLAFFASKGQGAPEVERTFSRARELCLHVGDSNQLFPVLLGLRRYYFNHAELRTTHEFDEQLLHLAQQTQDPAQLLEAHRVQGSTLFSLGDLNASLDHLEQGYQIYNQDQHRTHKLLHGIDPGTMCLSWASLALWTLGYPDKARQKSRAALTLSQDLSHAYSIAAAHSFAARFHQLCREMQMVREHAEITVSLSTEQGFPLWLNLGKVMQVWAQVGQEHREEGIAHLSQVLADAQTILNNSYFSLLLADVSRTSGQPDVGLNVLTEALTAMDKIEGRWCEAELHRLKGELLLKQSSDNATEAEACFQQAITIAQNQSAKSWELRAATSLARLWQSQGKRDEARELLEPVYSWFTEGHDTADLIDAKALLDELS